MSNISVRTLVSGEFASNTYLLLTPDGGHGIIVDPGGNGAEIVKMIEEEGCEVVGILNTHGHADHVAANHEVKRACGGAIVINAGDARFLTDPELNLSAIFPEIGLVAGPEADILFSEETWLELGPFRIKAIPTPGHTPGSSCFLLGDHLFSGDTLFKGSVGRTDLPGGDYTKLMESLKKIRQLDGSLRVWPGHGPPTNLGAEKISNPFFKQV